MTAQYKNSGKVVPLIGGISSVKFVLRNNQGLTKVTVVGKNGSYPVAVGNQPVKFTLVVDVPTAETGQCGEMIFPATPPARPSCTFLGPGATLRCN